MPESLGHQARFAIDDDTTFDAGSYRFEPLSCTVAKKTTVLDTNGLRGTRQHSKERVRFGLDDVSGTIVLNPSPLDLDKLLPKILGAAEVADVFDLAEALATFSLKVDKSAQVVRYDGCVVSRAVFRCSAGQLLELSLDLIGKDEVTAAITWEGTIPALGTAAADAPYVFSDTTTLTLLAANRAASLFDFTVAIDHRPRARYTNSATATDIFATDLIVTLECSVEYSAASPNNTDLYDAALAGGAGVLTLANGGLSLQFDFGNLVHEDRGPEIAGKDEIPLRLFYTARKSGSTAAIKVTNDSVA